MRETWGERKQKLNIVVVSCSFLAYTFGGKLGKNMGIQPSSHIWSSANLGSVHDKGIGESRESLHLEQGAGAEFF